MAESVLSGKLALEEVKNPNSTEFKRAMEIYKSSFQGEIAEDPSVMRKALIYTNMPGFAKKLVRPGKPEDFHLVVFKDKSISGSEAEKIVGLQTFSYYPDKNFAIGWYLAIDNKHKTNYSPSSLIEALKKKVEEYASRYGQNPLGIFGEIELTNTKTAKAMEKYVGMKKLEGMNYLCHQFRKGENPPPANLYFLQMGDKTASEFTPEEKKDIVRTIYSRGYNIRNVDKDPVFQQVAASIKKQESDAQSSYHPRRPL